MVYNQPHTIYYKAAKKLLHAGMKMMSPDKLRPLRSVLTYMMDIGQEALGFDVGEGLIPSEIPQSESPSVAAYDVSAEDPITGEENVDNAVKKKELKPLL